MSKRKRPPLVDRKVLHSLEDEFDDPGPAHSFVRDFVAFWDERYCRLVDVVQRHDEAASLDALLSVRIGAAMIGAARLACLASDLEESLKRGHLRRVEKALPEVKACGDATVRKLVTKYLDADW